MACSRSSFFDCCQPFWSLQPWVKSPVGKFSLSKFQAVAIKSIPSVKKFDLVLKQLQVVLSKLFHTARLSKYTLPRSCQPRRISWILLPPLPEVRVLLLKSSYLSTLFSFQQVDLPLKSFLRLAKEVKRSRQESQEVWNHLEVSRLKKNEVCQLRRPVFHQKKSKLKFTTFAKKNWHPVWSFKIKSWSQFEVHGSMAVKWQKQTKWGGRPLKWKTRQFGVNVPEVQSWSFLKFQKNEVTKPQQNQTKTKWSVPWLSTRSVLNSYGECCEKYVQSYVYVWSVKLFSTHVQYEVRQLCRRDTWSQATWDVSEVLPLWCTLSSHRRDSKYQPLSWLKQHPKQQVLG